MSNMNVKQARSLVRVYRYLWWMIRIYLCDIGGRLFGNSVTWCRIHGQWQGREPWIERFFWQYEKPRNDVGVDRG